LLSNALLLGSEDGTPSRPSLPVELVHVILRFADCKLEDISFAYSEPKPFEISSHDPLERYLWFYTEPMQKLSHIWGIQLHTLSGNQGFPEDPRLGCWSWFELVIYSSNANESTERVDGFSTFKVNDETFGVKLGPDGEPLKWFSHWNFNYYTEQTADAGQIFDLDHPLWSHVSPKDRLAVVACCQFPAWVCKGKGAYLKMWRIYDPTTTT
jgi:hypothetical protein